jgi:GMP synthase PP-ATPase subunit
MRKNESLKVEKALKVLGLHLKVVDATETFLHSTTKIKNVETKALCETVHPEEKRKIIGKFIANYFYMSSMHPPPFSLPLPLLSPSPPSLSLSS